MEEIKNASKKILVVCGEASGDLHAANLVSAIKDINPDIQFFGLGGEKLKSEGVSLIFNIVDIAVVGFFEVLKNLKKFHRIFVATLKETDKIKPSLAILIDYPGFNLHLAKELKKRGIPIIYYISPQVWAWGENRIKTIKQLINHMLVAFKFEEELYKKHNIPVSFVGHPLLDVVKPDNPKENLFAELNLDPKNITISLLPGSREREVKTLLPIMLDSAKLIRRSIPSAQFIVLRSPTVDEDIFKNIFLRYDLPIYILSARTYAGLTASDFALVASGTATLETAILGIPMVILYKVSFLTWLYVRTLIKIPYIGLVNVVKQKKIIEEFLQYNATPRKIADYIVNLLKDTDKLKHLKNELLSLKNSLGEEGASKKAARIIVDFLNQDDGKSHKNHK